MTIVAEKIRKKCGAKPKQFPSADLICEMAKVGLTKMQIAKALGMCFAVFKKKLDTDHAYKAAFEMGKYGGIQKVANAFFVNATLSNNFNAQAFYLRCRDRRNWNDKPLEIKHTHEHNVREDVDKDLSELDNAKKR